VKALSEQQRWASNCLLIGHPSRLRHMQHIRHDWQLFTV
jgi:hypothetical protein